MRSRRLLPLVALSLSLALLLSTHSPHARALAADARSSADDADAASTSKPVAQLLREGNLALTTGQYAAAVHAFDEALAQEPDNYLTYYRRATAHLSLGRAHAALADLDALLQRQPNFEKAHLQRGKVLAKEGRLDDAKRALDAYLDAVARAKSSSEDVDDAKQLRASVESAIRELRQMDKEHRDARRALSSGKRASNDKTLASKLEACVRHAGVVIDVAPNHLGARSARAECHVARDEIEQAMMDWSRIAHLAPTPELLLRLSTLSFYVVGGGDGGADAGQQRGETALRHLKSCLSSDPDNKACAAAHRKLRRLDKALAKARGFAEGESWRAVLSTLRGAKVGGPSLLDEVEAVIVESSSAADESNATKEGDEAVLPPLLTVGEAKKRSALLHELRSMQCHAHVRLDELDKAKSACEAVLARDPDDVWALVARGETLLREEKYEEAVRDLGRAFEKTGQRDRDVHARLVKAQKRLKQSQTKDYYKVLGVPRNADAKQIKRAFRQLAKQHHPDKGGSAEKMAAINEAFKVLSDPELRARFDAGDDPNDPMAQQQQFQPGGFANPFMQGGFPGGGGGGHPFESFFQQAAGGGGGQQFFQFQRGGGGGGGSQFFGGGGPFGGAGGGGGGGGPRFHFNF